jgi:hydrophobe/amphiphile efflux-1 (HAE1) family protein
MAFNISAWSIRKPIPTIVLFIILTLAGFVSFPMLGIDQNPNIDVPAVLVTVVEPGADPTELETQVTKKIEDAVAGLGNIDEIISTVNDSVSSTLINFTLGTNSDRATNDVRNAVAQIRQNLPQGINEPIVKRLEWSGGPIMTYVVAAEGRSVADLSNLVDQTIARAVLAVPGVAQVQRIGGIDREIRINLDPARLQASGVTATQINDQVRSLNINLPGGKGEVGGNEQTIRTLGSAATVETLRNQQITLPKGGFVPLASLGEVVDGAADVRTIARLNNKPTVGFSVLRSSGTVLVTVSEGVQAAVATLQKTLPADVHLEMVNNVRADYIRDSYSASVESVVLGAVLAVVTIWIFLRDWRATLIVAIALPLSLIPTFAIQNLLGYTLNNMTLLALALVVGVLVDDAIVEVENIERHQQMGKSAYKASIDASDEIGLAVVATTMSIVAVFMPIALMTGVSGQYFRPFGVTVAASVLFSLLVARTITPMMSAYMLRSHPAAQDTHRDPLSRFYRRLLIWALNHRVPTLAMALAFLIGSFMLAPYIPTGLFENGDIGLSIIHMKLPPGSTMDSTDRATQQLTEILLKDASVVTVQSDERMNQADLFVKLKPRSERTQSQQEFEKSLRKQFPEVPGVRLSFDSGSIGGGKEMAIVLKSEDAVALTNTANELEKQMRQVPGLVEVSSSASLVQPEILVKPNMAQAADQGVSVYTIARTASIATLGDNASNLAKFDLPDRQIPIRVQIDPKYRNDVNTMRNLQVPTKSGDLIPLQSVASIEFGSGPSQIDRYNRSRKISVEANLQGVQLGDALKTVHALPALKILPTGVREEQFGNAKIMKELFSNITLALSAAVLFIYAVLVLLFGDFLHPITIMVALPFSIGGALMGLLIAQKAMGLFALIGIMLLLGLVTKNSILLVDYALLNQAEGMPLYKAIVESGIARLRPILMTTIAMISGMIPIGMGLGAGSETRSPMAIAVIGGLITSTLLTLVVVPVIFTYIDWTQHWIADRLLNTVHKRQLEERVIDS